ncbi:MAG: hypothetical protein ACLFSA_00095 [Spirochaetaceae bacterium]
MKLRRMVCIVLFSAVVISAVPAESSHGTRVGAGVGIIPKYVLIFRPGKFDFKGSYDLTEGNEYIYAAAAYRFVNLHNIDGPLHFSIGAGGFGKLYLNNDNVENMDLIGGVQLPAGLSLLFLDDVLELFVEFAPGVKLNPRPEFDPDNLHIWAGLTFGMN